MPPTRCLGILLVQLLAFAHGTGMLTSGGREIMMNFTDAFIREVRTQSARGGRIILMDVGANDGQWSQKLMQKLKRETSQPHKKIPVELILFEPQRSFRSKLRAVADKWNGTFVPAAAWIEEAQLDVQQGSDSQRARIVSHGTTGGTAEGADALVKQRTHAIDFVRFFEETVPTDALVYLKLDIESAEYVVLPRLLTSGIFCRISFLHIEWHLNQLPEEQRLEAYGMRKAFKMLHRRGCATGPGVRPRLLVQEEYRGMNYDEMVPGLLADAAQHAKPHPQSWRLSPVRGMIKKLGVVYKAEFRYNVTTKFYTYIDGV